MKWKLRYYCVIFRILIDRNLKMETIIANIELDENLDKETKKQQVHLSNFHQFPFLKLP